jgi:hypothetical protein
MPSGAAQLPSHRGGRCRHRGAVIGCPAPQTLQPERGLRRPAGGRRRRGHPGCPDTGHAGRRSIRILCPPCGQRSVQRVRRTSGVQASGVHATGVMRVSGQTRASGVRGRCSRAVRTALDPRNASVPRDRPRWAQRIRRGAVVGERLGCRCPNRAWRGRDDRASGSGWLARVAMADLGRRFARAEAGAPHLPPGRQGRWSSARCRSVGRGHGKRAGAHESPRRCVLGRLPA